MNMVKNLTEGRPLNLLFFFALPMVAGNLFQQLYNMVDTAVVGKFVGEDGRGGSGRLLLPHRVFVGGRGLRTVHGLYGGGVPAVRCRAHP